MAYSVITKPTIATEVSKADFGDKVVDNFAYLYGLRTVAVWIPLNGATALTTSDKGYAPIPSSLNGGLIVGVSGRCLNASSSGTVTITIKNGATSVLSTNVTMDATKTSSLTSAVQPVIDTAHDDLATDDMLVIEVTGAGTGVTWAGVFVYMNPAG